MTNMHCGVRIGKIDDILDYTNAFGYLQMFYGSEDRAADGALRHRKSLSNFSSSNKQRRVCMARFTTLLKCAGISKPFFSTNVACTEQRRVYFFGRCITGTVSGRFSRNEESCLVNCVDRFLDTSLFIVKKIEEQNKSQ